MTDVKTRGHSLPRTMADSGQDNERIIGSSQDRPNGTDHSQGKDNCYVQHGAFLVHPARLNAELEKSSTMNKDKNTKICDDETSGGSLFTCSVNGTCVYRDQRYDTFEETSSSQDTSSTNSQNVAADNEIDTMFEEILRNPHSSLSMMSRSSSSSSSSSSIDEDFDGLRGSYVIDDSDWDDYELSNNDNDEWSVGRVAMSIFGNLSDFEAVRTRRHRGETEDAPPLYPHRAMMYHECQVCLSRSLMRRRVCCDFHICSNCLTTYVSMKVNEAKVQIECPNDSCHVLIHRDEVNERLPKDMKDKFAKFLVNANTDPLKKTCPACSQVYLIEPKMLSIKKKILKLGVKVQCPQCKLHWCFQCQAPFHTEMTCKQYQKGDKMVKQWAKELSSGQSNAQKCPKCKIFIQKVNGCDHMKCSKCNTNFCYRCGDRYIRIKLLGNHWSKFSLFGCKYRLMPKRPALRRLIRGANFAARLVAGVILAGLGLAAGAILVGASVVIVPGYGIFRLRRHLQLKEKRKRRQIIHSFTERDLQRVFVLPSHDLTRSNAETGSTDSQQVQVMVHRSVSFTHEDAESVQNPSDESYDFYINKYTADGTDMVVSGVSNSDSDQVIVLTEVTEVQNFGGYPTVVAQIVSKMSTDKEVSAKSKVSNRNRKEASCHQPIQAINPSENSLGIDDHLSHDVDDVLHKESSFAEGCLNNNLASTADIPSCSWENLSGSEVVDSGYGDNESCQHGSVSKVNSDDAENVRRHNNGCFGNMFSRRTQAPLASLESPAIFKHQTSSMQKKSFIHKAATWEKCHKDHVQSVLKASPLDPVNDLNNMKLIMQRPPVSAVNVANMFNTEVKSLKPDFNNIQQSDNLSESFRMDRNMSDIVFGCESPNDSSKTESPDKDSRGDERLKKSNSMTSKSYFCTDDCHISLVTEVTRL